ncbi:MAG TPA: hypothetical protein VMH33_00450, partial [Solirubrobacterales bacterium]|nr:hypothetical protein [Solirubrobacterales bacterium]
LPPTRWLRITTDRPSAERFYNESGMVRPAAFSRPASWLKIRGPVMGQFYTEVTGNSRIQPDEVQAPQAAPASRKLPARA